MVGGPAVGAAYQRLRLGGDVAVRRYRSTTARSRPDLDRADAADHHTGDRDDAVLRVPLSPVEQGRQVRAQLGSLGRPRAADLGHPAADHHRARRADLDQHASARSLSSARPDQAGHADAGEQRAGRQPGRQAAGRQRAQWRGQAARGAGGRARLEVAVHLSRIRHRHGQRTGCAGRSSDPFPDDVVVGDERVLHPGACGHDLHDARHADDAERGHQQARQLRGLLVQLQRRGLLGHALPLPRRERCGLPGLGRARQAGRRQGQRRAEPRKLSPTGEAEREGTSALLQCGRAGHVQAGRRTVRSARQGLHVADDARRKKRGGLARRHGNAGRTARRARSPTAIIRCCPPPPCRARAPSRTAREPS
jgi:hypothetical protein